MIASGDSPSGSAGAKAPRIGALRTLFAILALAAAVRVANLALMSRLPIADFQRAWQESDMAFNWTWSGRILAGDVLGRDTVYEYTDWMQSMAPLDTWQRWWGGQHIFYQAPLYPYTLAGMRLVAGDGFWSVGLCQALLGVASVALVFLLAARLFGGAVPAIAAVGAALYGPFLLHEPFLLRDSLAVTTSLLLLWCLVRSGDSVARWLVAGMLFTLAVLARESALLFGPFVALWMVQRFRAEPRLLGRVALAFVAGCAAGFAPLVARNVAVGALPLSFSTRAIEIFLDGNAVDSGLVGLKIPAATRTVLEQADGHLGRAVRSTLATYGGDWRRLVANEWFKLRAIFARYEGMDDVNWYYFVDRSPLLRFSLRYDLVLALGVLGLWLDRRNAGRHRLLWYFLLAAVGGLMYGTIVGRYRLAMTAVLILYAAVAVDWLARELAARRWRAAVPAVLAAIALGILSAHLLPSAERLQRYRPDEFHIAARSYYDGGDPARAFDELASGLETAPTGPDQPTLPPRYDNLLALPFVRVAHELGRDRDAATELERLAAAHPADGSIEQLLGFVYRDGLGKADEADRHFARAATLGVQ